MKNKENNVFIKIWIAAVGIFLFILIIVGIIALIYTLKNINDSDGTILLLSLLAITNGLLGVLFLAYIYDKYNR